MSRHALTPLLLLLLCTSYAEAVQLVVMKRGTFYNLLTLKSQDLYSSEEMDRKTKSKSLLFSQLEETREQLKKLEQLCAGIEGDSKGKISSQIRMVS